MSDVTFDEPQYARSRPQEAAQTGSLIGLMYKLGIAKTKTDANLVMGGIIVVCLVLSATMFIFVQPHEDSAKAAALQHDVEAMNAYQSQHQNH